MSEQEGLQLQGKKILIAGATGYLGNLVAREFKSRGYYTRVIVRDPGKFQKEGATADEIRKAGITDPATLAGCCQDIDLVFSSVGITRQKDNLTYMDVDFQGNMNLLEEAKRAGVKKFIYVSVLHGDQLRQIKICAAKEKFVDELRRSGLDYCVFRPTGFFSDMGEYYKMATTGRVYLFGDGEARINPVGGADLAKACVDSVETSEKEVAIGGPEILSHNQIADVAFRVAGRPKKVTHIPSWLTKAVLWLLRSLTSSKTYGPVEFLITVLSMDMVAPKHGSDTLENYFETLKNNGSK